MPGLLEGGNIPRQLLALGLLPTGGYCSEVIGLGVIGQGVITLEPFQQLILLCCFGDFVARCMYYVVVLQK